ncbi:MAG: EamA/RhaT family transporter, partial [Clostridia bacterium]|nr:EamA/RhaT family transporter [Clostridia bacterium]
KGSGSGQNKRLLLHCTFPWCGIGMWILGERPAIQFYIALIVMIISTYFMIKDTIELQHTHSHIHVHGEDTENHEHKHPAMPHEHLHFA